MNAKKNCRETGFTLIEVMIVVSIIALMVGMGAYTYLSQISQINLRNDAREVDQALQLAKMRALATGKDHGVVFNLTDGRYFIFIDCDNDHQYTGNFNNHAPVGTWEACETSTYDPRVSDKSLLQLADTSRFKSLFCAPPCTSTNPEYVLFNHLGQAHRNNILVDPQNPILIQSKPDRDGRVDEIEIRVTGGTGVSDILPMRRGS